MSSISLFVALPFVGAFSAALLGRSLPWFPGIASIFSGVVLLFMALAGFLIPSLPSAFASPDLFSSLMLVIVNSALFLSSLYSLAFIDRFFTSKMRFYTLLLLSFTGANGMLLTTDFFTLFIFLELLSFSAYALVGFSAERNALRASFKYLVMGSTASLMILLGIAFLYGRTSSLSFSVISSFLQIHPHDPGCTVALGILIAGALVKLGIVPFHGWVSDAYGSAPAPISAALSGAIAKVAGLYLLIRIVFHIWGITPQLSAILIYCGLFSAIVGSLLALIQEDMQRTYAWSTISQKGYILVAFGLATPLGLFAALLHLFSHALFKPLLFLGSGNVKYSVGTTNMKRLGGLSRQMPFTCASMLIGSLSASGVPPLNGFWSKLCIILACFQAGFPLLALTLILVSIVTLGYTFRVMKLVFFRQEPLLEKFASAGFFQWLMTFFWKDSPQTKFLSIKEPPLSMKIPLLFLAIFSFGMTLLLPFVHSADLQKKSGELFLYHSEESLSSYPFSGEYR